MTKPAGIASPLVSRRSPKISVLIPSYNHEAYISEAIQSVLCQDWPELELLLLDDGSTDKTLEVAERAVKGERRVQCSLSSQPNAGVCITLNRLMSLADGDIIAILNSDDAYAPRRFTKIMERSSSSQRMFGFSAVEFIESGSTTDFHTVSDWYKEIMTNAAALPSAGFALLQQNMTITTSNFVFTRDLVEKSGGFDPKLPLTQDWDFALRCLPFVEPTFSPEPLLSYRMHPQNTWRKLNDRRVEQSRAVLRTYFSRLSKDENPIAPSAQAWPHFFRVFLGIGRQVACDTNMAQLLRDMGLDQMPQILDIQCAGPDEIAAIARLVARASGQETIESSQDLAELIAHQWLEMREARLS